MSDTFSALVARAAATGELTFSVETLTDEQLPPGEVTIAVEWSGLNYKDALAARGHRGIIKQLPHVPGIDAAGTVLHSSDARYQVGQAVLVTGYELGCERWGAWAEQIRVPADWVVPLPSGLTPRQAMLIGTAGFTAAQCVEALLHNGLQPNAGPIVVTGASGGVGSVAVMLLSQLGFHVNAVTGKDPGYVKQLGAVETLSRDSLLDSSSKPLLAARWAGVVDTVGGTLLASIIRSTQQRGCITACGLVGGHELPLTVYPFILRGVRLIGIDSAHCPYANRLAIWQHLATDWLPKQLEQIVDCEITLEQVPAQVTRILAGQVRGRVLVRVHG
jgi:putative YhdH/YhfP family quinone oxidoreductase